MLKININGVERQIRSAADTPLLWLLRDELNLTGTKFGCGIALCGACTVQVDGVAVRSCVTPAGSLAGKKVRTIEGLQEADGVPVDGARVDGARADGAQSDGAQSDGALSVLQQAWISHQVPQCGYCQSGMLMAASALLATNPAPTDADIDKAITNICRCGTYQRIRGAIHAAARAIPPKPLVGAAVRPVAAGTPKPNASAVNPSARGAK